VLEEVAVLEVESDGRRVILDLAAEAVGQPSESAHPHPHREVGPLNLGRGYVFGVGVARHDATLDADALWASPRLVVKVVGQT
jgi:hypothetical protein